MAATSKYYITFTGSPGEKNLLDFDLSYGTLSLAGQEYQYSGTSAVDLVFVRPGIVFDFTGSGASADRIYLTGNYADYSASIAGTIMTLSRTVGQQTETVKVSKAATSTPSDRVVFADGTVNTFDLYAHLNSSPSAPVPAPVPAGETSLAPVLPATLQATVKAYAVDSGGETFAPVSPGMNLIAVGSSGVDIVYIRAGSNVDASSLGSGTGGDKIYFTGNWADYTTKTVAGTTIIFQRTVGADTEYVKVAAATGASNDRLIFADGYVLSNDAKAALQSNASVALAAITGYSNTEVTPLPGPTVAITSNDSALKIGDVATLTFTLSEASTNFAAGDITVTGGMLSSFAGSGAVYTASFAPTASSTTSATVNVAGGRFTNAAHQNNTTAPQLSMTVDTVAPVAAAFAAVATDNVINSSERTAGITVTGTNEAGATVTLNGNAATAVTATTWSYNLSAAQITAFGEGPETLTAISTDAAGNTTNSTRDITVDITAPAAATIAMVATNDNINAAERTATVTLTGSNEAGATVILNGNATTVASATTWSYNLSAAQITAFGEGPETLTAISTDAAGNTTSSTRSVTIDTVAAVAATFDAVATDNVINSSERTAGITVTGTNEAGATVTLNGNAAIVSVTTWSYALNTAEIDALGQGAVTLTAVSTDAAGNTTSSTKLITVSSATILTAAQAIDSTVMTPLTLSAVVSVVDSSANINTNLAALLAQAKIDIIDSTDNGIALTLTAAQGASATNRTKLATGDTITVSDLSADINTHLAVLLGDAKIDNIDSSENSVALTLTAAQGASATNADKLALTDTIAVSDTGGNITNNIVGLTAEIGKIDSISAGGGAFALSVGQLTIITAAKLATGDTITVSDTSATINANLVTLLAEAKVDYIDSTGTATLTLTTAQAGVAGNMTKLAAGDTVTVSDTSVDINANLAALLGNTKIDIIDSTDNGIALTLTAAQAGVAGNMAKLAVGDTIILSDNSVNIQAMSTVALGDARIDQINSSDSLVTLTAAQFNAVDTGGALFNVSDALTVISGAGADALNFNGVGGGGAVKLVFGVTADFGANFGDTVSNFAFATDVIDTSAITSLTKVYQGVATTADITTNANVIVLGTATDITTAAAGIAANIAVTGTAGLIVITNTTNTLVYHTDNLGGNGNETLVATLSGITNPLTMLATSFVV